MLAIERSGVGPPAEQSSTLKLPSFSVHPDPGQPICCRTKGLRLRMQMGSKTWFFVWAGLFTPNAVVPMTLVIDVRRQDDTLAEIEATAMSDLPDWLIPRPGDRGRYEDAFERLFSNLMNATESSRAST